MGLEITGVPADKIIKLAREIGSTNRRLSARDGARSVTLTVKSHPCYLDAGDSDR